jgi:DNA topoisomerase-1
LGPDAKVDRQLRAVLGRVRLRYVCDTSAGYRRERNGSGFVYRDARGRPLRNPRTLKRIESIVIPPAWRDVWICPAANGHVQATGRDARGRKQYRYHPRWSEIRSDSKYDRLCDFAGALSTIRRKSAAHIRQSGLTRQRVLATVVRILDHTLIRVGGEEYARDNGSYGLATLRCRHVKLASRSVHLQFRGKSGQHHEIRIDDPRLVKIVRRCHELPGHELFKYIDEDGHVCDVGSGDINAYIREISGSDFTSKDFRTWGGTVHAAIELCVLGYPRNQTELKHKLAEAVRQTALRLGNRPAACRKHYIHPTVFDAFENRTLIELLRRTNGPTRLAGRGLSLQERAVLRLLQRRRAKAA